MVIADSDVIIAAIRGNEMAKSILKKYAKGGIYISLITAIELNIGATNASKKAAIKKVSESHETLPINKAIGELALRLVKTHNTKTQSLYLADALIAATCLHHNFRLITFNSKDFAIIKGLQFAK
jgi:predicted nucleic acid-binding protein